MLSLPSSYFSSALTLGALSTALVGIVVFLVLHLFYVDIEKIKGIPEIPGGNILAGHLYMLGDDHATTAELWSRLYKWPVFQIRMGRRRAIILNSFDEAHEWMVKNQSATLDRPWFYTFHGVVSATSAATIGTSPWNERTKKQRRVVGSLTTGPSIHKMRKMLDVETFAMVGSIYMDSQKGTKEVMPHIFLKRLALNMMTMFCYGTRFSSLTDPLLRQILSDATTIASFRSTNSNPQDFIPHLRLLSKDKRTATAVQVRQRRDEWLAAMLAKVGVDPPLYSGLGKSVAELLLTDQEESLTKHDIRTILGGLMSGGFETVFSTAIIAIGVLSTKEGRRIQERAYQDITNTYDTPEVAFDLCLTEEKCAYVGALIKETLRFYPPLKLLPARQTYKDFTYQGTVIPKGVLIYMNAQAINRDETHYGPDAGQFRPERWMQKELDMPAPDHFAFGAGARMCTAVNFSNRLLYAIFVRSIICFKFSESKAMPAETHYVRYKDNPAASTAVASDFRVRLEARDDELLKRLLERSKDSSVNSPVKNIDDSF